MAEWRMLIQTWWSRIEYQTRVTLLMTTAHVHFLYYFLNVIMDSDQIRTRIYPTFAWALFPKTSKATTDLMFFFFSRQRQPIVKNFPEYVSLLQKFLIEAINYFFLWPTCYAYLCSSCLHAANDPRLPQQNYLKTSIIMCVNSGLITLEVTH